MVSENTKSPKSNVISALKIYAKQLLLCTLLLFIGMQTGVATEKGMDVALVLDTSGSMKKNDPNQLREQAAKLFVSLLSRKDKVSVIGFSNRAYPITPLLSLNSRKNESKLLNAIEKMNTNGRYSNLHDAIQGGYDLLKQYKSADRMRHIILMSDGKMDLGNQARNLRLLEQTLEELTPKLAKENIKIHTIAFTDDSYIPLLKLAAEDTGGEFILLKNSNGIHQVFENMFERTKNPDMLPLDEDSFVVDKAVKEVTIVASKYKYNTVIAIQSPEGEELTRKNHSSKVKWYKARKFDLVTITDPAPGYWLIKFSEGGNKAYIVSDIKLEATSTKQRAESGTPLHIQALLKNKNRRITNSALLNATRFSVKVTSPTGATIENSLVDDGSEIGSEKKDGIYGISYAFEKQGPYKIEVTAKGETFDRKKTLFIDVNGGKVKSPFSLQLDNEDNNQTEKKSLADTAGEESNSAKTASNLSAASDTASENSAEAAPLIGKTETETTQRDTKPAEAHTQSRQAGLDDINNQQAEMPADLGFEDNEHGNAMNEDDELKANSKFGVKDAVIAFISFNVFLILLGGGYYLWHRKKQKQKAKDTANEKDDNEEDSITSKTEEFAESERNPSDMELEPEDNLTTSISEAELESELTSILENEKNAN